MTYKKTKNYETKKTVDNENIKFYKSLDNFNVSAKFTGPVKPIGQRTTNDVSSLIINKPIGDRGYINAFARKQSNLPLEKNINLSLDLGKGFSAYGGKSKNKGPYYGISFKKKF
jgi:hypothetical protein|tara:strand:+ start:200 stop:541 length:342 start_codon:yes stop_codon:yes gene_type:complete